MKILMTAVLALVAGAGCMSDRESRDPRSSDPSVQRMRDPVCGMMVDSSTTRSMEQNGETYYFCSDECLAKFKAAPESFTSRSR